MLGLLLRISFFFSTEEFILLYLTWMNKKTSIYGCLMWFKCNAQAVPDLSELCPRVRLLSRLRARATALAFHFHSQHSTVCGLVSRESLQFCTRSHCSRVMCSVFYFFRRFSELMELGRGAAVGVIYKRASSCSHFISHYLSRLSPFF